MNDEQRAAWRERWRTNELAQVDREWARIASGLALIGTFMADHGDAALQGEIAALTDQAVALRERCQRAGE